MPFIPCTVSCNRLLYYKGKVRERFKGQSSRFREQSFHSLARFPNQPQVVRIRKLVACDLLLVAGTSAIGILEGVELLMGVKEA